MFNTLHSGLAGMLLACAQMASGAAGDATMFGTNDILEVRNVMPLTRADDATPVEIEGRLDDAFESPMYNSLVMKIRHRLGT